MIEKIIKGIDISPLKDRRPNELAMVSLNVAGVILVKGILRLTNAGAPFIAWASRKTGEDQSGRAIFEQLVRIPSREESDLLLNMVMNKYQRLVANLQPSAEQPMQESPIEADLPVVQDQSGVENANIGC